MALCNRGTCRLGNYHFFGLRCNCCSLHTPGNHSGAPSIGTPLPIHSAAVAYLQSRKFASSRFKPDESSLPIQVPPAQLRLLSFVISKLRCSNCVHNCCRDCDHWSANPRPFKIRVSTYPLPTSASRHRSVRSRGSPEPLRLWAQRCKAAVVVLPLAALSVRY